MYACVITHSLLIYACVFPFWVDVQSTYICMPCRSASPSLCAPRAPIFDPLPATRHPIRAAYVNIRQHTSAYVSMRDAPRVPAYLQCYSKRVLYHSRCALPVCQPRMKGGEKRRKIVLCRFCRASVFFEPRLSLFCWGFAGIVVDGVSPAGTLDNVYMHTYR
jgi:hypothetical protein